MRNDKHVLLIMFDLPNASSKESAAYRKFRKCLTNEAYIQIQESVYIKAFRHHSCLSSELARIRENLPDKGNVLSLPMHMKAFREIVSLLGPEPDFSLLSDDYLFL